MNDMSPIDHFNLWSFDLNLLVAFDALMRERSVTRAAARLKIQQPAMSHNLASLRLLLDDELFVRIGPVMRPTPRALELAAVVRQILEQAHRALTTRATFCPANEERTFTIGFSSELEVLLIPELTARLRREAPNVRLLARPIQPDAIHRALDDAIVDLGVGCFVKGNQRYGHSLLFEQSLMCCFNPRLLDLPQPLDLDTYLDQRHALVSQNSSIRGCLDEALRAARIDLDVVVAAPEFLTILGAALQAPVLATLPARIVRRYAPLLGLETCPIPLDLEVMPIAMVWAAHCDQDPASAWLRDQIAAVLARIETTQGGAVGAAA